MPFPLLRLAFLPNSCSYLLARSTTPSLWLCVTRNIISLLPFSIPTLESCFELFYQLSCFFQFRFTHPGRLPVNPVLHNTINRSLTDDVADFPRIGLRVSDVSGLVSGLVRSSDTAGGVGWCVTDSGAWAIIVVTFSDAFSVTVMAAQV